MCKHSRFESDVRFCHDDVLSDVGRHRSLPERAVQNDVTLRRREQVEQSPSGEGFSPNLNISSLLLWQTSLLRVASSAPSYPRFAEDDSSVLLPGAEITLAENGNVTGKRCSLNLTEITTAAKKCKVS